MPPDVGIPTPAREACPRTSAPRAHDASASLCVGALLSAPDEGRDAVPPRRAEWLCDCKMHSVLVQTSAILCSRSALLRPTHPLLVCPPPHSHHRVCCLLAVSSAQSAPHCGMGFPHALCHRELPLLQLSSGASRSSVGPVGRGLCGRIGGLSSSKLSYATCSEGVSMLQHAAQRRYELQDTNRTIRSAGKRWCAPGVAGGDGAEGGVSDARGEKRPRGVVRRHPLPRSRALSAEAAGAPASRLRRAKAHASQVSRLGSSRDKTAGDSAGHRILRKCRDWDFSRLGGAHRLEEGVDVAYKVAEVSVGPRVLREELAANHLAAHTGGVAPVGVDPAAGNAEACGVSWESEVGKLRKLGTSIGVRMPCENVRWGAAHCPSSMLRGTDQLPSPRRFALKPSQYSMTKTHGSLSASSSCRGPIVVSVMAATAAMASSEDQEGPATRRGGDPSELKPPPSSEWLKQCTVQWPELWHPSACRPGFLRASCALLARWVAQAHRWRRRRPPTSPPP